MTETVWSRIVPVRFKAILLSGLIAFVSAASAAAADAKMRVGFEIGATPMSYLESDGKLVGFSPEFIAAIAHEMQFEFVPVAGTWQHVLAKFRAGEIDMIANVAKTPERDAFMDFAVVHARMQGAIFVRKGTHPIKEASDLARVRVAVRSNSVSHSYLLARGWDRDLVVVDTLRDCLHALDEGRCDAVVAVEIVGNHIIRRDRLERVVATSVPLEDFRVDVHMAVRAGDADRLAVLNEGLARIRENGTYDRLYARWIGPLQHRRLRLADLQPFILPAAAFLAAVIGALLWQRRLVTRLATQRRQLQESEERLRHVLEGSEDGFWDFDVELGRVERSERWAAMLGYTLAEIEPTLLGHASLVHPDDLPAYRAWQERLASGTDDRCDVEYRMRAKTGEWRWILDRGKVVARAPDGRPLRMAGTHTDITARKTTEAALMESQALLKRSAQLLEQTQSAARIGGWESDLRTGRVYWTSETHRIHENSPREYQPTRATLYQFYTPESRQKLVEAVDRAIRDGAPYALELDLVTARKRLRRVHTTGVPEAENGSVIKLYGSFRDVTEERAAEQERDKLQLKMVEAQKLESLGVLAGGIAHDFNNLLTVILANATFIRSETGSRDERVIHIETAARRAADLCRQMLAYAGKASFVRERIDLGALVRETTQLIHVSISKKACVELALASPLPVVEGDVSQLRQVVMNLVINASEALGDRTGNIRIATRVARPEAASASVVHSFDVPAGDCVCLEVTDTGSGMTPATLARIFDPFFTTKFAGRGLGLAAVLGIVRTHRGALTVQSAPGESSTFRLYLPVSPRQQAGSGADAGQASLPREGSGTILIADDEPNVLETADALLRHFGYTTVLARDGREAVECFRAQPAAFRAVLLDLTMPALDGAEAARVIRATNPTVPLLVMSGFSEQDVVARVRGLGNVAIVRKPFTQQTLLGQLAEIIGRGAPSP